MEIDEAGNPIHHEVHKRAAERRPHPPPIPAPKLARQCSEAKFKEFKKFWWCYKLTANIPAEAATSYLLSCLEEELKTDVQAANNTILSMTEDEVMNSIKQHAIQQWAISSLEWGRAYQEVLLKSERASKPMPAHRGVHKQCLQAKKLADMDTKREVFSVTGNDTTTRQREGV